MQDYWGLWNYDRSCWKKADDGHKLVVVSVTTQDLGFFIKYFIWLFAEKAVWEILFYDNEAVNTYIHVKVEILSTTFIYGAWFLMAACISFHFYMIHLWCI